MAEEKTPTMYMPHFKLISNKKPTAEQLELDASLKSYMDEKMKLETDEGMRKRSQVVLELAAIFKDFIRKVAMEEKAMSEEEAEEAGGTVLVSGSHRLGVRDLDADIDTVCVAPNFITKEHFFTVLKEEISTHPEVTGFSAAENAFVPLMAFEFSGVSIDLLFARLAENTAPKSSMSLDWLVDDKILKGTDQPTVLALNGPRVAMMITRLVNISMDARGHEIKHKAFPEDGKAENKFLIVLRCVRRWARCKGLYANRMGYFGGINLVMLVTLVCQLYPNASSSTLIIKFFQVFSIWNWQNPVKLNEIQQAPFANAYGTGIPDVWSKEANPTQNFMPIITPAYPAMNSMYQANENSVEVITSELTKGFEICKSMSRAVKAQGPEAWDRLFTPSDFFIQYAHYLQLNIVCPDKSTESNNWSGFCESRIVYLSKNFKSFPMISAPIHLHAVRFPTNLSPNSIAFFIGFNIDEAKLRGKTLMIEPVCTKFAEIISEKYKEKGGNKLEGCDFNIEHKRWKDLPKQVFTSLGGKAAAKARRREQGYILQAPPAAADTSSSAMEVDGALAASASAGTGGEEESTAMVEVGGGGGGGGGGGEFKEDEGATERGDRKRRLSESENITEQVSVRVKSQVNLPVLMSLHGVADSKKSPYVRTEVVWG